MAGKSAKGWTEQIIGRWFAQGGGRREKVVLATKLYGRMGEWPNQARLSALHIRKRLRGSLRRLQHRLYRSLSDAPYRPGHAVGRNLASDGATLREGKLIYVGSSNFAGWHIAQAQELATAGGSWASCPNKACTI